MGGERLDGARSMAGRPGIESFYAGGSWHGSCMPVMGVRRVVGNIVTAVARHFLCQFFPL